MKKRMIKSILLIAMLSVFFCLICVSSSTADPKGQLVSAYPAAMGSMDPNVSVAAGNWPTYIIGVFEGLIAENLHTYEYVPALAESWKIMEDGMIWEFKLRKGVKFHNGEPFNANAVKFSVDRMLGRGEYDPELKPDFRAAYRGIFNRLIDHVEIVDDYTVRYHMKVKSAEIFPRFTYRFPMLPPNYIREVGDDGFAEKPIGTGCFKIKERKVGESITLEANADYWNKNPEKGEYGIPHVKTVVQKLIPEDETRISALRVGEVDLVSQLPAHRADSLEKDPNIALKYAAYNAPTYVGINTAMEKDPKTGKPNPWRDLRLRKAVNYAINRQEIINAYLTGRELLHYMITPGQVGFDSELAEKYSRFDPEKAKALVKEAGYPDGIEATLHVVSGIAKYKLVGEAICGYLTNVGIRTKIEFHEIRQMSSGLRSNELYPFAMWAGASGPEPLFMMRGLMHSACAAGQHKGDARMDQYIEQAFAEFDSNERGKIYQKLFTYHAEDVLYFSPLFCEVNVMAIRSDRFSWEPSRWIRYPKYHGVKPLK